MKPIYFLILFLGFFASEEKSLNEKLKINPTQTIDFTKIHAQLQKKYNLTLAESRSFYSLCDSDRADFINVVTWRNCEKVFIFPYEKFCLKNNDKTHLLDKESLKNCLETRFFQFFPKGNFEKMSKVFFSALFREKYFNLMDFLFIRRVYTAYNECFVDEKLNKQRMSCALRITTPSKRSFLPASNQVFNTAIRLYKNKNIQHEAFLGLFSFTRIARIFFYFHEYLLPFQEETLTKQRLLQAIEARTVPLDLNVKWVTLVFKHFEQGNAPKAAVKLDFSNFAALLNSLQVYKGYSEKNKFNEDAFLKFVNTKKWVYFKEIMNSRVVEFDEKLKKKKDQNEVFDDNEEKKFFMRLKGTQEDFEKNIFKMFGKEFCELI